MEDWEQFFSEKSRRRRDVVERRDRAQTRGLMVAGALLLIFIIAAIALMH